MGIDPGTRVTVHPPAHDAGPAEKKLYAAVTGSIADISLAESEWRSGADALGTVARALETQATELKGAYGSAEGSTGAAAARAYLELATVVRTRETEMTNVADGLQDASTATISARGSYRELQPPLGLRGSELVATATPEERATADSDRQTAINQRNAEAQAALSALDTDYQNAAEKMGAAPTPDTVPTVDGGGPGSPTTTGAGPTGGTMPGLITKPPTVLADTGTSAIDPIRPDLDGPGEPNWVVGPPDTGTLSGTDPVAPVGPVPPHATGPGATTGGGLGAVGALGAGAVSGTGAVLASRGGTPLRAVPSGTSGQIGKSSTSASRGTLGRAALAPGQSGQAGGRGSGGRGAGRGVAAGATNGQAQGKAGGRGGRGVAAGAGGAGRKGKGGEESQEHFQYDDSQNWLDDEATGKPVID